MATTGANSAPQITLTSQIGVYELTEPIVIKGYATDAESDVDVEILVNNGSYKIISGINGGFLEVIPESFITSGLNVIKVIVNDGTLSSDRDFYIMRTSDKLIFYSKGIITKEIILPMETESIIISGITEGTMNQILASPDNGQTWEMGEWDKEIRFSKKTNTVKLCLAMSEDAKLRAYGVGWFNDSNP